MANVLSPRQREVAELISQDLTNNQIALKLGISEQTVKSHEWAIAQKWGCETRTGIAVKWVLRNQAKAEVLKLAEKFFQSLVFQSSTEIQNRLDML